MTGIKYNWTDNATEAGVSQCNPDVLNENLMHLKYNCNSRFLGETFYSFAPILDISVHLLDGSLFTYDGLYREFIDYMAGMLQDYPNLFITETAYQAQIATYGVCAKFVYNSDNKTLRIPKVTGIIEGTIDVAAVGELVEAGLPDHEHKVTALFWDSSGIIEEGRGKPDYGHQYELVTTKASENNPIYGNSETVQPQTVKGFVYMVVANATNKNGIIVDVNTRLGSSIVYNLEQIYWHIDGGSASTTTSIEALDGGTASSIEYESVSGGNAYTTGTVIGDMEQYTRNIDYKVRTLEAQVNRLLKLENNIDGGKAKF